LRRRRAGFLGVLPPSPGRQRARAPGAARNLDGPGDSRRAAGPRPRAPRRARRSTAGVGSTPRRSRARARHARRPDPRPRRARRPGPPAPADAARAADALLARSEGRDLVLQCRNLVTLAGASAAPILDELLARDDVAPTTKRALSTLRGGLGRSPAPAPRP